MHLEDVAALGGEPTQNRDLRTRGKETVGRLLSAGQKVVEQRGHDEARVDDIVDLAGLSHGTFYLYFRDREDLLHSLIRLTARELRPLADGLTDVPTQERLAAWIGEVILAFDRHAEVLRAARALSSDEAAAALVEPLGRWFARLPQAEDPMLAANLLVWHIERAAVRDDIVDHDALAGAVLRAVGCS